MRGIIAAAKERANAPSAQLAVRSPMVIDAQVVSVAPGGER